MSITIFGNSHNDGYVKELKKLLDMTKEYNITKLKHAQKKFYLSKDPGRVMQMESSKHNRSRSMP